MTFNKTRTHSWTATSAFVLSLAAFGLSVWSVGCQEQDETSPAVTVAARGASKPAQGPAEAPAQNTDQHAAVSPRAPASEVAPKAPATKTRSDRPEVEGSVSIKRLIATKGIDKREPLPVEDGFVAGDGQVFAFLEVENSRAEEAHVKVTFHHESGKKVGFISLNVPANQPRWRTWGRTGQIKKPGKWEVVVSDEAGNELQRSAFEVSPAAKPSAKKAPATSSSVKDDAKPQKVASKAD